MSAPDSRRPCALAAPAACRGRTLRRVRLCPGRRDRPQRLPRPDGFDGCQDEFLMMLAHELRAPLAPIRSAAQVLDRLACDEPRIAQAAQIVQRQVAHLAVLLEQLLDASRLARGLVEIAHLPVELDHVVADAIDQARAQIAARGHALAVEVPAEPVVVLGDAVRLTQVLANLLANAAQYTPAGGRIGLRVACCDTGVALEVDDSGMGLSSALLARAFEPFVQTRRALDRAAGGLGLGLTLARGLTALHGGRLEAASAGPGRGATFTVWLPRLARAAQAANAPAAGA